MPPEGRGQAAASWGPISVLRVLCRHYQCGSPTHGAAPATHQRHLLWEHNSQRAMGALALGSSGPAQPAAGRGVHSQRHRDGRKRVCCVHGELASGWHGMHTCSFLACLQPCMLDGAPGAVLLQSYAACTLWHGPLLTMKMHAAVCCIRSKMAPKLDAISLHVVVAWKEGEIGWRGTEP
jgi:hypothetical protein